MAEWTSRDSRLKASVVVPFEDGPTSAKMIEARAGDPNFAQVLLLTRTAEPLGQRRYWPIYEAAAEANLPVGIHAFGYGGTAMTSGGWPSYYIEEMVGHAQCQQAVLTSLIFEGVFERFPTLKVVLVEAGFAWAPAHAWRMDRQFAKLRKEVPHLKRLPSEYMRSNVWFTTQPVEEPEPREHLADAIEWMGWDRVLFATDYPHWDFDDPGARAADQDDRDAEARHLPGECARGVRVRVNRGEKPSGFDPLTLPESNATSYPEAFRAGNQQRWNRRLGDHAGLTNYGVNMTRIVPGGQSSHRHAHSRQDEFIVVMQGTVELETNAGIEVLTPGMCAGFPAGSGNAHRFVNRSTEDVLLLVIGDRTAGDEVSYPDIDMHGTPGADGRLRFLHKDGTPY